MIRKLLHILMGILLGIGLSSSIIFILSTKICNSIFQVILLVIAINLLLNLWIIMISKNKKLNLVWKSQFITNSLVSITFLTFCLWVEDRSNMNHEWFSENQSITTPFYVDNNGHIGLEVKLNKQKCYLLFDNGAGTSVIGQETVNGFHFPFHRVNGRDINGIEKNSEIYYLNNFTLEGIHMKNFPVVLSSGFTQRLNNPWFSRQQHSIPEDNSGISLQGNSPEIKKPIQGLLGHDFISKYIWDFDLKKEEVTISIDSMYCTELSDAYAIDLFQKENQDMIEVLINDSSYQFMLDFGSINPLRLKNSAAELGFDPNNPFEYVLQANSGFFSSDISYHIYFIDVSIGNNTFKEIQSFEDTPSNIVGIPFMWSYERVILDYFNHKLYLISPMNNNHIFNAQTVSRKAYERYNSSTILQQDKVIITANPEGSVFIFGDSIPTRYRAYGKIEIYNFNNGMDRIIVQDSVQINNGPMKYGRHVFTKDSNMNTRSINNGSND